MPRRQLSRNTQLATRKEVVEQLRKIREKVDSGFQGQVERADENLDCWDAYLCRWGTRQGYDGRQHMFQPLIYQAVEARKTRHLNALFPQTGKHIEVTTEDGEHPDATTALLELYVDRAELKSAIVPPMLVSGDLEGQYTVCVTWKTEKRMVVSRETKPVSHAGISAPSMGEIEVIKEEEIEVSGPDVELVSDSDLLILPQTASGVMHALELGGSVTTVVRWTESRIEELIASGELCDDLSAELLVQMRAAQAEGIPKDTAKKLAEIAGIKNRGKHFVGYRTWCRIDVQGKKRLVLAYFGDASNEVLGARLCPYWDDEPDIGSVPVRHMPGLAKGMSLVRPCLDLQYFANDISNEGADSATYGMLPVVMTDPEKNPRIESMVMDVMAVWPTSPRDTEIVQLPQLYQHAFNIVEVCKREINATLSVNPAMLPQRNSGTKPNQAQIAQEQQIDLMTTSVELAAAETLLSWMLRKFASLDAQFRDDEIVVRMVGELGVKSEMERVPPLQAGNRWRYRWYGVESARSAAQIQQQISAFNVIAQMSQNPAVAEAGYRINPVPFIREIAHNAFSPRIAPEIFENRQEELSLDPEIENTIMAEGHIAVVTPMDNDAKHIQLHLQAMQADSAGMHREVFMHHIQAHQQQMQMKARAQIMQQMAQQLQQGAPGPQRPQQQRRGPQPGSQVAMPRQGRQPAGRLHPDQLTRAAATGGGGVVQMPRRF